MKESSIMEKEGIRSKIHIIRGQQVMFDIDLASFYRVSTKILNQAVKRNIERFPKNFMFQLTDNEKGEVVTNCDHLFKLKYSPHLPYAFTEQGVAMLSAVLKSKIAVKVRLSQIVITSKQPLRPEMELKN